MVHYTHLMCQSICTGTANFTQQQDFELTILWENLKTLLQLSRVKMAPMKFIFCEQSNINVERVCNSMISNTEQKTLYMISHLDVKI